MNTQYDLFEKYDNVPNDLKMILDEYQEQAMNGFEYSELADMLKKVQSIGYTFEYYLDAEPYALRPIGVKVSQLVGYEDYED